MVLSSEPGGHEIALDLEVDDVSMASQQYLLCSVIYWNLDAAFLFGDQATDHHYSLEQSCYLDYPRACTILFLLVIDRLGFT